MPMSTGTKRILAIVVVAVIAVGIVGVYIVIQPPAYETPGVSGVPRERIIKIGILNDMTDITGKSCWNGAKLAAWEINAAGGVTIGGTVYYIGLIAEDTNEANPSLDITKGTAAADKILTVDGAQFIVGGFRTESLLAYRDKVMDKKILFLGTGAATDVFCNDTLYNYAKYKYWFRFMPINSSMLGRETIFELLGLRTMMASPYMLNRTVKNWAILREDLDWTKPMDAALKAALPYYSSGKFNATPSADIAYPITAGQTDFNSYMSTINASGAQILIPIISAQGGSYMMTAYNSTKPGFLICGIDVPSQLESFWGSTGGKCAYEIGMQPLVSTNKTPYSIAFWKHYVGNFSATPLYTGVGSYDAVNTLAWAIGEAQSLNSTVLVPTLESIKTTSPTVVGNSRVGVAGRLAFTRSHDLLEGYNIGSSGILWSVTLWVQWGIDGKKHLVTSAGLLYPTNLINESLPVLPPWGINHA